MKRNFLSPIGSSGSAKSRDPSPLSRKASVRTSGADTTGSEASAVAVGRRSKSSAPALLSKPTREQQEYIQKLFAEIPGPSPLAGLRIAQPHGSGAVHPTIAEANGSSLALADAMSTGLYSCLMQFTSVEMLEADNAFQCRRCWKLLNPALVAQIGRKRATRVISNAGAASASVRQTDKISAGSGSAALLQRRLLAESVDGTPTAGTDISKDYMAHQTTPRASISTGSDMRNASIQMNRQLPAERDRQLNERTSQGVSPVAGLTAHDAGPTITVTTTSPPMSPPSREQALPSISGSRVGPDAGDSGFSQLTVTETRTSTSDEGSAASHRSALDDVSSDGGVEADESDAESQNAKKSARNSVVSFSDKPPPGRALSNDQLGQALTDIPTSVPALPPRAKRFVLRRAHKRYLISSLPQVLVLHLKRFQQTSKSSLFGSFNNLKKLDDKVTFPLYLDMAPFMAPPPVRPKHASEMEKLMNRDGSVSSAGEEFDRGRSEKKERSHHHKHWFRRASPSPELRENCQYRLFATINHQGSSKSLKSSAKARVV